MGYDQSKTVPVDKDRFRTAIINKGLKICAISEEMGRDRSYISGYMSKTGGLPEFVVKYLQKWYGIPYSDYEPEKVQEEPEKGVDVDTLVKALKAAIMTYDGQKAIAQTVRFVLQEEATEDMLKKIVKEAIQEQIG